MQNGRDGVCINGTICDNRLDIDGTLHLAVTSSANVVLVLLPIITSYHLFLTVKTVQYGLAFQGVLVGTFSLWLLSSEFVTFQSRVSLGFVTLGCFFIRVKALMLQFMTVTDGQ